MSDLDASLRYNGESSNICDISKIFTSFFQVKVDLIVDIGHMFKLAAMKNE